MRKIEIEKWKSKTPDGQEVNEDTLAVLNAVIGNKRPESVPKGLDPFRIMSRIGRAFTKADETGILVLEEAEYIFIKHLIENDIPSIWGMNDNISKAIEAFLEVKNDQI